MINERRLLVVRRSVGAIALFLGCLLVSGVVTFETTFTTVVVVLFFLASVVLAFCTGHGRDNS